MRDEPLIEVTNCLQNIPWMNQSSFTRLTPDIHHCALRNHIWYDLVFHPLGHLLLKARCSYNKSEEINPHSHSHHTRITVTGGGGGVGWWWWWLKKLSCMDDLGYHLVLLLLDMLHNWHESFPANANIFVMFSFLLWCCFWDVWYKKNENVLGMFFEMLIRYVLEITSDNIMGSCGNSVQPINQKPLHWFGPFWYQSQQLINCVMDLLRY